MTAEAQLTDLWKTRDRAVTECIAVGRSRRRVRRIVPSVLEYDVEALDGPAGRLVDVVGGVSTADGAVSGILVVDIGARDLRAVPGSRLDDVDIENRVVRIRCGRDEVLRAPEVDPDGVPDVGLLLVLVVAHYFRPSRPDDEVGEQGGVI